MYLFFIFFFYLSRRKSTDHIAMCARWFVVSFVARGVSASHKIWLIPRVQRVTTKAMCVSFVKLQFVQNLYSITLYTKKPRLCNCVLTKQNGKVKTLGERGSGSWDREIFKKIFDYICSSIISLFFSFTTISIRDHVKFALFCVVRMRQELSSLIKNAKTNW